MVKSLRRETACQIIIKKFSFIKNNQKKKKKKQQKKKQQKKKHINCLVSDMIYSGEITSLLSFPINQKVQHMSVFVYPVTLSDCKHFHIMLAV